MTDSPAPRRNGTKLAFAQVIPNTADDVTMAFNVTEAAPAAGTPPANLTVFITFKPAPPPAQKYGCDTAPPRRNARAFGSRFARSSARDAGKCVPNASGAYTTADCDGECSPGRHCHSGRK